MARVLKFHPHALAQVNDLIVLAGVHILRHLLGVLHGVQRLHRRAARPLALAVFPLSVLLLNVGRVQQHNVNQIRRKPGGDHLTPEPVPNQLWNPARVVNVGVGQQHVIHTGGIEGKLLVGDLIPPLLQAAVD